MSSKSYLSATNSGALCHWNLNKARCFPVPLTHKPMLWTLQLMWGNLQGIGSRQEIYRNEAVLLCHKHCHRGWNIYLLIYLVSSCCRLVFYSSLQRCSFSATLCAQVHWHQRQAWNGPKTTTDHSSAAPLLPTSEPCVKGQSWDARVRMGRKRRDGRRCKIQFGCGKKWLAAYTSDCETLHWETHPETGHSGCPVQSGCPLQGTDRCSVGPEEAQPAMPRGWKLQLLAGSTRRSSFQHGPRTSLRFQAK